MRALMSAVGTRGDVQPMVALAKSLRELETLKSALQETLGPGVAPRPGLVARHLTSDGAMVAARQLAAL